MRTAFINALLEAAKADPRIMLVTGDLGFGVVTDFMRDLPAQFVNAGVAEQNMTGLAAGLALSGRTVATYSIANFPTLRCVEQIRNDVCYHGANVKIVSVGGGFAYGTLGPSHHATEDIAIMRALPGLLVVAPNDPVEARLATRAVLTYNGPCYLRLGRAGEAVVHTAEPSFTLGRAIQMRHGEDATIVATGGMLGTAIAAATALADDGIHVSVLSMHTIKPLDAAALIAASRTTGAIFALEEHSIVGGLGSAVAEALADAGAVPTVFRRLGIPDAFTARVGDQEDLRRATGLDPISVTKSIRAALRRS